MNPTGSWPTPASNSKISMGVEVAFTAVGGAGSTVPVVPVASVQEWVINKSWLLASLISLRWDPCAFALRVMAITRDGRALNG